MTKQTPLMKTDAELLREFIMQKESLLHLMKKMIQVNIGGNKLTSCTMGMVTKLKLSD